MAVPNFTMRRLLEAGVHFGHMVRRWNPRMAPYIFGERDGIHIIDLQQTVPMLYAALEFLRSTAAEGGRILFVGTKRQAQRPVEEYAKRCGQHYVNQRWLGGALTNWKTISQSITRLDSLDERLAEDNTGLTKKELLQFRRQRAKLTASLGGIRTMGGLPSVVVAIDTNHERIAVTEARALGIPVVGILDSNSDPDGIAWPIPGNDDATRAVVLYCELMSGAILDGLRMEQTLSGVDLGAAEGTSENLASDSGAGKKKAPAVTVKGKASEPAAESTPETVFVDTETSTPSSKLKTEPASEDTKTSEVEGESKSVSEAASEPTEVPTSENEPKPETGDASNETGDASKKSSKGEKEVKEGAAQ